MSKSVGVSWKCCLQQLVVTGQLVGYKWPVQPPTRLPPSWVGQGTKPTPCTKDLHGNRTDTRKCQNCTCRCHPWEQPQGTEEQPPSPPHCLAQGRPCLVTFKASAAFREGDVREFFFSPFSFAFWFLLKASEKVYLDAHC